MFFKCLHNQIKDFLAKEYKHFNSQIVELDKKLIIKNEKPIFFGDELRKRQHSLIDANILSWQPAIHRLFLRTEVLWGQVSL